MVITSKYVSSVTIFSIGADDIKYDQIQSGYKDIHCIFTDMKLMLFRYRCAIAVFSIWTP